MHPPETGYSMKEILELHFKSLGRDIGDLRKAIEGQEVKTEKRFLKLDGEMEDMKKAIAGLQTENARYKTIIGIGATVGATVFTFLLNRIF